MDREWIGTLDGFVNADIKAEVSGYLVKRPIPKERSSNRASYSFRLTLVHFRLRSIRPRDAWRRRRASWNNASPAFAVRSAGPCG